jgi:hypothetical protein
MPLPVLDESEAGEIIDAVCARYHKQLNSQVSAVLFSRRLPDGRQACGIPLWLDLAVEELLLLDADDFARAEREFEGTPEQKLHKLLLRTAETLLPDVEGLYGYLLTRAAKLHGEKLVQAFAELMAAGRTGGCTGDLQELAPKMTGEAWEPVHALLAAHTASLPSGDPLRASERMHHLIGADDKTGAAAHYGDVLLTAEEAEGATRALAAYLETGSDTALGWVTGLLHLPAKDEILRQLCRRYLSHLQTVLADTSAVALRLRLAKSASGGMEDLRRCAPDSADYARDLEVSYARLGDLAHKTGQAAIAVESYTRLIELLDDLQRRVPGFILQPGMSNAPTREHLMSQLRSAQQALEEGAAECRPLRAYSRNVQLRAS